MVDRKTPLEVFQNIVFEYCDGHDQIKLKNLYYDDRLEITDLFNVENNIKNNLCDSDLKN